MENQGNDLIVIQVSREITRLYKSFLEILESLQLESSQFLSDEKFERVRKKVLDEGNECSRQLIGFLDCFNFEINAQKVEELAKQKRVTRKVIIGGTLEAR